MHQSSSRDIPLSRPFLVAAIILNMAVVVLLCVLTPRMKPLHPASSANFWYAITRVDIGATQNYRPSDVIYDRDRFVFGSHYPFETYFDFPYGVISERDAEADFPRVQRELAKRAALNDPDDDIAQGFERWRRVPDFKRGVSGLIDCIYAARLDSLLRRRNPQYIPASDVFSFRDGLKRVASASRFYWFNFLFELLFFSGIIWFTLLPYIHFASTRKKILRIAAIPLLLYLPLWLGYCNPASPSFPVGGILYPYVTMLPYPPPLDDLGLHRWEYRFLSEFPPFLSVITQGRAVTYYDFYAMRRALPHETGPIDVTILTLLAAGATIACHRAARWWRKRRDRYKPGFPVLDVHRCENPQLTPSSETQPNAP